MPSLRVLFLAVTGFALLAGVAPASTASLRVAPVGFELTGGTATSTLRLRNEDDHPVAVQVRVFRWRDVNGGMLLEQTRDVVASPPLATLSPGSENIVRIVRLKKGPAGPREAYRVLVDELPDARARRSGQIKILVQHSIPLIFAD